MTDHSRGVLTYPCHTLSTLWACAAKRGFDFSVFPRGGLIFMRTKDGVLLFCAPKRVFYFPAGWCSTHLLSWSQKQQHSAWFWCYWCNLTLCIELCWGLCKIRFTKARGVAKDFPAVCKGNCGPILCHHPQLGQQLSKVRWGKWQHNKAGVWLVISVLFRYGLIEVLQSWNPFYQHYSAQCTSYHSILLLLAVPLTNLALG